MSAFRRIRLTLKPIGVSVIADLLDDEAPRTAAHVWDRLPIEGPAFHGQYSGAEVFVLVPDPIQVGPENLAGIPIPGELFYFYQGTENVVADDVPIEEVVFVYGRGVILRQAEGEPTKANLFGRVPGDWKHDWTDFQQACSRLRQEPQRLLVERVVGAQLAANPVDDQQPATKADEQPLV
jgi:uncharacterized protein DUF3830